MAKMGGSEALVESLRNEGVDLMTGIVGSAFMDALDIFPQAGIRFLPVRHEQNAAHMVDGYARVTGRPGVTISQNGPGISNMVTAIAAAYQARSPVVMISPAATTGSVGTDGFQETDQMKMFQAIVRYQVQVNRADRIPEFVRNAFRIAIAEQGPAQIDLPRDFLYDVFEANILPPARYRVSERGAGDPAALQAAAELLSKAKFPVIIAGMGVVKSDAAGDVAKLAEYLSAPVVTSYLHNDAFPCDHPQACGPVGYGGSKAAMAMLNKADVVLALGTRLSIFGTLPQYGKEYWPTQAQLVHVDIDVRQIGRIKPFDVGVIGDARAVAVELVDRLQAAQPDRQPNTENLASIAEAKDNWSRELKDLSSSNASPISPRRVLQEVTAAFTPDTIVTTDVGNVCSLANGYLNFTKSQKFLAALSFGNCGFSYPAALGAKLGRPDCPVVALVGDGAWGMSLNEVLTAVQENIPVVAVVFNNGQWGAEKRNQVDFYENRFLGTDFMPINYSLIAQAMGANAYRIDNPGEVRGAVAAAIASNRPSVVEIMVEPSELFDPFRRDALKHPVRHLPRYLA